jgi:hypothetical protein
LPVLAHAVDDVELVALLREQLGDLFGRVLQVAVHLDDPAAFGVGVAGLHGGLLAEVAREAHRPDEGVLGDGGAQDGPRRVAAAVVDEHDLEGLAVAAHLGRDALDEGAHVLLFVEDRHDDAVLEAPPPRRPGGRRARHGGPPSAASSASQT